MSKIILNKISAPENVSLINDNFQKIANEFDEKVLYRKVPTQEPNMMLNVLDMNGKKLYNLPEPVADHEAARLEDVKNHSAGGQYAKTLRTPEPITEIPNVAGRQGRLLSFDNEGNPVVVFPASDSTTQLRAELASDTGFELIGGIVPRFDTYSNLRAFNKNINTVDVVGVGITGRFVHQPLNIDADDGGITIVGSDGRRWVRQYDGSVNVCWFGAIPDDESPAQALINTNAFRAACLSMKSVWDTYSARYKRGRGVFVPPGDYTLSNGFTVPKGCSIWTSGLGDARLKTLASSSDSNPKIPLVSPGRVIVDATLLTEITTGAYVQDPPPSVHNIYLNPQDSRTALSILNIPGFKIGDLWVQADVAIDIDGGSGDGVFGKLFLEDSTGYGVRLGDCQNLIFPSIYTFVCNNPVVVAGNCNNINIGILQANYTTVAVLQTLDGTASGRISIESLVCNQNAQYVTFTDVVNLRSSSCDIRIDSFDARNYNGFAINNSSGINNKVQIGFLKLRQAPNKPSYTLGVAARGVRVNNCDIQIDNIDIAGLATSPFEFVGSFNQNLTINSGTVGTFGGTGKVVNITGTNGTVNLYGIRNQSGIGLFNHQQYVNPTWGNITNPFPIVSENGRTAVKVPFCSLGSALSVTVKANTAPAGNANYCRTRKLWVTQETVFSSGLTTSLYQQLQGSSSPDTAFTPDVAVQLDVNVVGGGFQSAMLNSGEIVISVPSNYTQVAFSITQEI